MICNYEVKLSNNELIRIKGRSTRNEKNDLVMKFKKAKKNDIIIFGSDLGVKYRINKKDILYIRELVSFDCDKMQNE